MSLSLAATAAAHEKSPALILDEGTLSWGELKAQVDRTPPLGERAVIAARRDVFTLIRIFAAIEQRVPLVLLSPRATEAERRARVERIEGASFTSEPPLACVFTSGSTGVPRAALLSRGAFVASSDASASLLPLAPGARWLLSMPLCHVGGLSILTRALCAGSAVVVAPEERWDAKEMVDRMKRHGVTHVSVVPTMLSRIVEAELPPPETVTALLVGGAACPAPLALRARRLGWPVLQTYGLTEACSQVATRKPGDERDEPGRVGPPLPGVDVRIVEAQIQVRGPMLFDGYASEPGPFTSDGFFATGDLGFLADDGTLYVDGRVDDLIVTGGENVHPAAVEAVLAEHPDVRACCVFGVDDPEWGQVVVAAVAGSVTEDALAQFASEQLSAPARPRRWVVSPSLPQTPSGKVDRRAVKEECA
jgi:O-succinylbenzoic acid--CoA ligase